MSSASEIEQSIARYEAYVRADARNPLLWLNLGELYHRASRLDEAIACFERCAHDHPEYASARSHLARVLISQHRFADAQRMLEALLEGTGRDPNLLYNLALSLYYQKNWAAAEPLFLEARKLGVDAPECFAYLARCRHYAGDMSAAMDWCQRWVDASKDTHSRGYLALLAMDSGQLADAQRLATEVLAESANDTNANLVVGTGSIEAQEIEQACRHFELVIAREPDNPRAWLGVGLARLYEQRHQEAVTALRKALDLLPDSVGIAVTLGWALLASRDARGAERTFRQAIEIDRGFGEAHGGLAATLALQRQIDEAQQCIRRAERLDPAGFGAAFARMVVLKAQGQHDAATDVLAQALQRAPRPDAKSLIEQIQLFARKHPPSGPAVASKVSPALSTTTTTQPIKRP
jgi:tetratricopeptide (TPR) repeat protein